MAKKIKNLEDIMYKEKPQRSSGIELLKIFAIIIIVLSHAIPLSNDSLYPYTMNLNMATASIQRLIIIFIKYGGQIGNAIFIICSSWFLLDNDIVKTRKILYMIFEYSLINIAFLIIFMFSDYKLSINDIIKCSIPILTQINWFIPCYIMLYMAHPYLNCVIKNTQKNTLLKINLVLFILYSCFNFVYHSFYYTVFVGFVCLYFIVAYVKIYLPNFTSSIRINIILLISSLICHLCLIVVTNFLGLKLNIFSNKLLHWCEFINPFIIIMALSLFNIAKSHEFVNKSVNYLSSLSMLVYIIHYNHLVIHYLLRDIFSLIYSVFFIQI